MKYTPSKKSFETYLRNGVEFAGVVDYALRAQIEPDGRVTFYIRPEDQDGYTADFEVVGDVLQRNRDILDWDAAKSHFDSTMQIYEDLVGISGLVVGLEWMDVFIPLLKRFNSGERTKELYEEMLAVE